MPRTPRIVIPGVALHVVQRGNNRSPCFFNEADYQYFLRQLRDQAEKCGCAIHAYCLMTNHIHLLMTPKDKEGVANLMKGLGQCYVQYINRTYEHIGTLWQGRYRSRIMQDEGHVMVCYRYIELNPVRAGMVQHPSEYRWSSYRSNAQGERSTLLVAHPLFALIGKRIEEQRAGYSALFNHKLDVEVLDEIRKTH